MMSPAVMSASASEGKGAGDKDNSQGCIKANANSQACAQNPNSGGSSGSECDPNGDGITPSELSTALPGRGVSVSLATTWINQAEDNAGTPEIDQNTTIDTAQELIELNLILTTAGMPTCS
jgi:hypothetical protein